MTAAFERGMIFTLWLREILRLKREPARWIGIVAQPILFWLILGKGLGAGWKIPGVEIGYAEYFYPGILFMIVLFTSIFTTMSVIEDQQKGFLQSVLVAPGSRFSLVLGKCLGVTTIVFIQTAVFLFLAPWGGYPINQISWDLLVVVLFLSSILFTSIGFAMAWLLHSTQSYHAIMSVILIPLWALSGATYPVSGTWLSFLNWVNPMSYAVGAIRHSLDKHTPLALGPSFGLSIILLLCFSILTLGAASALCNFKSQKNE